MQQFSQVLDDDDLDDDDLDKDGLDEGVRSLDPLQPDVSDAPLREAATN